MDPEERYKKFLEIEKEYEDYAYEQRKNGKGMVYDTEKGIFGTSSCSALFKFFSEIRLETYNDFLDLGSGDGRAVLIASLFTKATGIEFDKELCNVAKKIRDKLELDCEILQEDFLKFDISKYDFLFINPDQGFQKGLDEKLANEMRGVLFVYNYIFQPEKLKKGKSYWYDEIPIVMYENK